jgi:hypothetical protein
MEQQINLYQPILGAEKRLFSARAIAAALAVFVLCLGAISSYAGYRVRSAELAIAQIEAQEAARLEAATRSLAALRSSGSPEAIEARAKQLAADIAEREYALEAVQRGTASVVSGFSARLEALARAHPSGLWLNRIVLAAGERELALIGQATDAQLVPRYLGALADEPALDHARFDHFRMRQAVAAEAPASTVFEVGVAPELPPETPPEPAATP